MISPTDAKLNVTSLKRTDKIPLKYLNKIFWYCKYYSQGIVVFLVSNKHFDSKLLTYYYREEVGKGDTMKVCCIRHL